MAGIPPVTAYPLPTEGDLPSPTVSWSVSPKRSVLLVHDMQRYFLRPLPGSLSRQLVHHAAQLRAHCVGRGIPIAYTAQPGGMSDAERGLLKDFWGPGMRPAPEDRLVVDALAPNDADWMFTKWRYSAFFKTDLLERMQAEGRDQLILCGVYAHVGVLATAIDAFARDIQPFLIADATADFSQEYHHRALTYAAERCALVTTVKGVLA
ncbi:isochorismatase family protein [Streptomyces sp. NPDC056500]|uniref:isochorismatase family protein n=1 Tax=Streptomyces sp. NPDC056500 TaxID=3345840 RepID=UPI003678EEB9